jgi:TRAP-type uncharacterized transport system fused permease subunit
VGLTTRCAATPRNWALLAGCTRRCWCWCSAASRARVKLAHLRPWRGGHALAWLAPGAHPGPHRTPAVLVEAFETGAKYALAVGAAAATVGIVIGVVTLTGVGFKLSTSSPARPRHGRRRGHAGAGAI